MEINFAKKKLTIKGMDNRLYNLVIIKEDDEISFKSNIINNIWDIKYILFWGLWCQKRARENQILWLWRNILTRGL